MTVEQLVQSIDIVDYIGQYADLEERNGEYWCLSLFKAEKTPSFSIRRDPPVFYDYSSGQGGNIITFVKLFNQCTSKQAIEKLKEYIGCEEEIQYNNKNTYLSTIKAYSDIQNQKEDKTTILDEKCMNVYPFSEEKCKIWIDEGISVESLKKYNVRYDIACNRLVYPIRDTNGNIVNIGGRTLDENYKEKGLRKYTYYHKWGTMKVVYGLYENLDNIKQNKNVIVFEGAKSVMKADSYGITNTCAILTSHLNQNQMIELVKLKCDVIFALDKDVKIMQDKQIKKLLKYTNVYTLYDSENLLDEKDSPVDKGKDIFLHLFENKIKL